MNIEQFENKIIHQKINKLSGLPGSIDINASSVYNYYKSFIKWITNNQVMDIVNKISDTPTISKRHFL